MITAREIKDAILQLFFPHLCAGCGSDLLNEESSLCLSCAADLPETNFFAHPGNPVEKMMWGRLPFVDAAAGYYFTKESLMQRLIHQFKYNGNKELGLQLGRMIGKYIVQSGRFNADILVPLPLYPEKEKKRGYNQATLLCEGMADVMGVPVVKNAIIRGKYTETQTKKGRTERWQNMEGKFVLQDSGAVEDKHVLLVDDVITTGATAEACGIELLKGENTRLSIAMLCIASG
jgi:ComF family protein